MSLNIGVNVFAVVGWDSWLIYNILYILPVPVNGGYVYRKCVEISLKFRRKLLFVKDCIAVVLFNKSGITLH